MKEMGKQAKLKKIRKTQLSENSKPEDLASGTGQESHLNEFITNVEKQGYSLKKMQQSPVIPEKRIEPTI